VSTAGFLALSLSAAPLLAQRPAPAQRGGPPNADTPYILVTTFHSPDRKLGNEMADELRERIQSEHSAKDLYVIPQHSIEATLTASGYRPDSALSSTDVMELAKQLRGEQVIDGTITKTGEKSVHVDARLLMRAGQATVSQPLPPVDAKDAGDAAKEIERNMSAAGKAIPKYQECTNDLRAAKYTEAVAAANEGIKIYPATTLARICLLSAYVAQKAPADSIISVANAIRSADSTSQIALANLADAYMTKGDTTNAISTMLQIYRLDPTNTSIARTIVQTLAVSGAPDKAIPIVDSMIVRNPGDADMLKTKWLLQLKAGQYKEALASGEAYVKADTSAATIDYYQRQIGAAQSDSNAAAVAEIATRAAQKFPTEPSFSLLLAQQQMKAGQLDQALASARRATQANPKATTPWMMVIAVENAMGHPDSVIATGKAAVAAGVPADEIGASMLAAVGPALKKAQETKARADWQAVLDAAQAVDAIAPSPNSAYFAGVSSFSIAMDALTNVQALSKSGKKDDKAQACVEVKVAEDNLAITQQTMIRGGKVDPATAGTIMNGVTQYGDYIPQFKKALGCK
jgi:tetratricopeptide (TPR) repeat protein